MTKPRFSWLDVILYILVYNFVAVIAQVYIWPHVHFGWR